MKPKFPAIMNEGRQNRTDSNSGGSPLGGYGTKRINTGQRGGVAHDGRDRAAASASIRGTRGSSGNPASRGGFSGEARGGAFKPDARISGHGGSPQAGRAPATDFASRGGFGANGQGGSNRIASGRLPTGNSSNPQPAGSGNTSGRSYQMIAGRFKRGAMQRRPEGKGSYGGPPVR
jgi:hypothetical protein